MKRFQTENSRYLKSPIGFRGSHDSKKLIRILWICRNLFFFFSGFRVRHHLIITNESTRNRKFCRHLILSFSSVYHYCVIKFKKMTLK